MSPLPLAVESAVRGLAGTEETRRAVARIELEGAPGHPVTRVNFPAAMRAEALIALARRLGAWLAVRAAVEGKSIAVAGDHRTPLRSLLKRRGFRVRG